MNRRVERATGDEPVIQKNKLQEATPRRIVPPTTALGIRFGSSPSTRSQPRLVLEAHPMSPDTGDVTTLQGLITDIEGHLVWCSQCHRDHGRRRVAGTVGYRSNEVVVNKRNG